MYYSTTFSTYPTTAGFNNHSTTTSNCWYSGHIGDNSGACGRSQTSIPMDLPTMSINVEFGPEMYRPSEGHSNLGNQQMRPAPGSNLYFKFQCDQRPTREDCSKAHCCCIAPQPSPEPPPAGHHFHQHHHHHHTNQSGGGGLLTSQNYRDPSGVPHHHHHPPSLNTCNTGFPATSAPPHHLISLPAPPPVLPLGVKNNNCNNFGFPQRSSMSLGPGPGFNNSVSTNEPGPNSNFHGNRTFQGGNNHPVYQGNGWNTTENYVSISHQVGGPPPSYYPTNNSKSKHVKTLAKPNPSKGTVSKLQGFKNDEYTDLLNAITRSHAEWQSYVSSSGSSVNSPFNSMFVQNPDFENGEFPWFPSYLDDREFWVI